METRDSGWSWASVLGIALVVLAIIGLGWGVAVFLPNSVELDAEFDALQFLEHLAMLAILATAIERATQSALFLTKSDGTDRAIVEATGAKVKDGSRAAMMISLPLGLAVGLTGIGVITPLIAIEPTSIALTADMAQLAISNLQNGTDQLTSQFTAAEVAREIDQISTESVDLSRSILRGVDTVVTGGLLAGGASGIHQVAEVVKSLVRGPDRARADILAGTSVAPATGSVLSLERGSASTQLWHLDRAFKIEGIEDGLQEGTYHRVALRGTAKENMFIEFPLTTETGRVPKITTTDVSGGGLSIAREDLSVLIDRLGGIARDDLKLIIRRV